MSFDQLYDSIVINYPLPKILCNRAFHLLANLFLPLRVRDISNNLKLMRAEILKGTGLSDPHFAANIETGLKPLLAGFRIVEVLVSWINRTAQKGRSSFRLAHHSELLLSSAWHRSGKHTGRDYIYTRIASQ